MSAAGPAITPEAIKAASALADLPLSDDRAAAVAELLTVWVPAANDLSARMQSDRLHALLPAAVFTQSVPPIDSAVGRGRT